MSIQFASPWVSHLVTMLVLAGSCLPLLSSPGAATEMGKSFVDTFESFDRERWYISHGWSNGAHQSCAWFNRNVKLLSSKEVMLSLTDETLADHKYTCAEIQTVDKFGYGTYEVRMRPAKASGTVSAFFNYVGSNSEGKGQDEIDIEFLGKDTSTVQLNYFVNGDGNHAKVEQLGFDASTRIESYAYEWLPDSIRWFINGKLVHEVKAEPGKPMPKRPGKIYISLWSGAGAETENWLGPFKYPGTALTAVYDRVAFTAAGEPCQFEGSVVCGYDKKAR